MYFLGSKLIEKSADGGRKLTQQGRRDIDRLAAQINAHEKKAYNVNLVQL